MINWKLKIRNWKFVLWLSVICYLLFAVLPVFADEVTLDPAIKGSLPEIIGRMIKLVLGLVGVLALIMFIYGGITWMTSGGNMEQVKKGKNTLVWAVMGLAVVFFAYSLVQFVITKVLGLGG